MPDLHLGCVVRNGNTVFWGQLWWEAQLNIRLSGALWNNAVDTEDIRRTDAESGVKEPREAIMGRSSSDAEQEEQYCRYIFVQRVRMVFPPCKVHHSGVGVGRSSRSLPTQAIPRLTWAVLFALGVSAHAGGPPAGWLWVWEGIIWTGAEEKTGRYLHQQKVNKAGASLAAFRLLWDKLAEEQRQCLPAATLQLSSSFYAIFDL